MEVDLEIAYLGIDCRRPAETGAYLRDVVGLMPGEPRDGLASTWRVDGKAARVWLREAPHDDAACIGFEAVGAAAYERTLARLDRAGIDCTPLGAARKAERQVEEGVSMPTPWGVPLEVVRGLADAETPFASAHYPEGFVTAGQGFGHVVFVVGSAEAYEASRRFAIDALGLKLSDRLRMPMGPIEMNVSFLHCNPRHHSLAIAFVPMPDVPQKLHHVNFEVSSVPPVGAAYERALTSGTPIANTIGQHENDRMVSFYSVSPGGWRVEVGATGRTIGDDWDDTPVYDRISHWGHQPPEVLTHLLKWPVTAVEPA